MKNWRSFFLSLLSIPSLLSVTSLLPLTSHAEPLVWKATKGEQQLMLVGTIHLGDQSMYPLPQSLKQFLAHSDGLVLETDVNSPAPQLDFSNVLLTKDALDIDQMQQLVAIAQKLKLNPQTLGSLPPWLTAVTIENQTFQILGFNAEEGVDQTLYHQAEKLNVPLLTFETMKEQLDMLQNLPNNGKDLLLDALKEEADGQSKIEQTYHCMVKSWKDGDQANLLKLLATNDWDEETSNKMLYIRNSNWAEKIVDPDFLSPTGHYVIAVGALHLMGQKNLRLKLAERGYQITQLTKSQKTQCGSIN
ncbi:MAG: TraB/GumN family protein [Vibrio sp.]